MEQVEGETIVIVNDDDFQGFDFAPKVGDVCDFSEKNMICLFSSQNQQL